MALETALGLGLALVVFLGGKGCLSLGGGRPPGEGMAVCSLVTLPGMRGGYWQPSLMLAFASSAEALFLEPSLLPAKINIHIINVETSDLVD